MTLRLPHGGGPGRGGPDRHGPGPDYGPHQAVERQGPGYVSRAFRDYLGMVGIKHILAAPFHPQTNGKLERYHQTLKRDANQVPYELPSDLEAAVVAFVNYYNYRRYHKALGNVTPSDVLRGRRKEILQRRREAKAQTIQRRRRHDRTLRELATPQTAPDLSGRGVSQFCWLPTRHTCDGLIRRSIHWPYKLGVCLCLGETLLQSLCVKRSWGLFRG